MTRRQSNNQWIGGMAAHPAPPQKFPSAKNTLENFSPRFFWIKRASSSLIIIQRKKKRKPPRGKFTKGVLFLHDNAPVHRGLATQKKLFYLSFQCLHHPPCSLDLAPLDYDLFPGLKKKQLKVGHFSSDAEVILATVTWLNGQHSESFVSGLQI